MIELIGIIWLVSLWNAGLSIITDEGYLLHPLIKPFLVRDKEIINLYYPAYENTIGRVIKTPGGNEKLVGVTKRYQKLSTRIQFWLKPVILCPTCMASFWGFFWYCCLSDEFVFMHMILIMVASSYLGSLLYSYYYDQ